MTDSSATRHLLASGAARPIADLIEPAVEAAGFSLIRVILGGGSGRRLQIMAERQDGSMNIEDCARLSRALSAFLDEEERDPIEGSYALEVSSPGVRRPLSRWEDFRRWSGHAARLELNTPLQGRKKLRGRLGGVAADAVTFDVEAGDADGDMRRVSIPPRDIARACLLEENAPGGASGGAS